MTNDTANEVLVADLARALFALDSDGADDEARKSAWEDNRRAHMATARKLLRRLEAKGYSLTKAG